MVRTNGANKNGQIVPENWINDIKNYEDNSCYLNQDDLKRWKSQGYWPDRKHVGGYLCDMTKAQPDWNPKVINWFSETFDAINIGTSYFKMTTCSYLPKHIDTYDLYRKIFKCDLDSIIRLIIFLTDWKEGHISEIDGTPIYNYQAGDFIYWESTTPHMAGNMGIEDRYTLQITGHTNV